MRISTSQIFEQSLAAMLQQQTNVARSQNQISTGERIISPSDDPAGTVQALNLQRELGLTEQYIANANAATTRLQNEESVLDSSANILQRIRELAVQGLNATNTADDRKAISTEIKQLNQQLLAQANTRDANGDYLFSGFSAGVQPYESLSGIYQGDEGQRNLKIGPNVLVPTNDIGPAIFEGELTAITSTNAATVDVVFTPAPLGAGTSTAQLNLDPSSFYETDFDALTFTYLAGPPEEYEITDGVTTATIPYVDGAPIQLDTIDPAFPPISLTLSGVPEDGDVFDVSAGVVGAEIAIKDVSFVGDSFDALTFTYSEGPPAQYTISDGVNTEVVDYVADGDVKLSDLNDAFPSLTITMAGSPNDGDQIVLEKTVLQPNQTIFRTINDFALALDSDNVGASNSPNNGDFLINLDAVLDNVIDVRSQIGGRINTIEQQVSINEDVAFSLENSLSQIKDLDYAEAISNLTRQLTGLQASQQTFSRVQSLSLFNFL